MSKDFLQKCAPWIPPLTSAVSGDKHLQPWQVWGIWMSVAHLWHTNNTAVWGWSLNTLSCLRPTKSVHWVSDGQSISCQLHISPKNLLRQHSSGLPSPSSLLYRFIISNSLHSYPPGLHDTWADTLLGNSIHPLNWLLKPQTVQHLKSLEWPLETCFQTSK